MDTPLHFPLGKPVAITLPRCYDGEAEALCALLDAGAPVIHIRKPDAPAAQVEALLRQLRDAGADMTRLTPPSPGVTASAASTCAKGPCASGCGSIRTNGTRQRREHPHRTFKKYKPNRPSRGTTRIRRA